MTSRTIDIKCIGCRKYLFSILPDSNAELDKIHHCNKKACKEKATFEILKGPEPSITWEEMMSILSGKRI